MVKSAITAILEDRANPDRQYLEKVVRDLEQLVSKSYNYTSLKWFCGPTHIDITIRFAEENESNNSLIDIYASCGPDPKTFGRIMVEWYFPDTFSQDMNFDVGEKALDAVPYSEAAKRIYDLLDAQYGAIVTERMERWEASRRLFLKSATMGNDVKKRAMERAKRYAEALKYFKRIRKSTLKENVDNLSAFVAHLKKRLNVSSATKEGDRYDIALAGGIQIWAEFKGHVYFGVTMNGEEINSSLIEYNDPEKVAVTIIEYVVEMRDEAQEVVDNLYDNIRTMNDPKYKSRMMGTVRTEVEFLNALNKSVIHDQE